MIRDWLRILTGVLVLTIGGTRKVFHALSIAILLALPSIHPAYPAPVTGGGSPPPASSPAVSAGKPIGVILEVSGRWVMLLGESSLPVRAGDAIFDGARLLRTSDAGHLSAILTDGTRIMLAGDQRYSNELHLSSTSTRPNVWEDFLAWINKQAELWITPISRGGV